MELVQRNFVAEFRKDEASGLIRGTPIVVDTPTDIGGMFKEVIRKGAIKEAELKDVSFFWNHDLNSKRIAWSTIPLEKLGGMELSINDAGNIEMVANPNKKRTDVNDLYLSIEDGTCNGMSFMFGITKERWEDLDTDYPTRYIEEISPIIEVSAVNYPAYKSTEIYAREGLSAEKDKACLERARHKSRAEAENLAKEKEELELLKLKTKVLYGGGI